MILVWRLSVVLIGLFTVSACSTVDKRTYYQTHSTVETIKQDPIYSCEMGGPILTIPFSQKRDVVEKQITYEGSTFDVSVSLKPSNQFKSYWWGPLWVPIVPIFLFRSYEVTGSQVTLMVSLEKKWREPYDPNDKSTWAAHGEEAKSTKYPNIDNVTLVYRMDAGKEMTLAGQSFLEPGQTKASRVNPRFKFDFISALPQEIKIRLEVDGKPILLGASKVDAWLFELYLFGCIQ